MYEYAAFNPYNSSPESLAAELTKKSADGWEVVSIVTTFDGRYCAFLRKPTSQQTTPTTQSASQPSAASPSASPSTSTSKIPAAWYADPSGRYELRYWDGNEWTEHVARSGQQFVDPPVA